MTVSVSKKLFIFLAFFSSTTVLGQAPGGVTGDLTWWLKANAGVYETSGTNTAEAGDGAYTWDDQSTSNNNAVNSSSSTRPIYRVNVINDYPALEFDGTKFMDAGSSPGIGDNEDFIVFLVFKLNSYQTNGGTNDGGGTFIIDRPTATFNLASFKIVNSNKYFYQRREDDNTDLGGPVSLTPVNTTSFVIIGYYRDHQGSSSMEGIYINGRLDVSQSGPTGDIPAPPFRIGRHATNANGGIDGYFAEIAVYDDELSTGNRQRVESYLAIKYGITLDPSVDYLHSGGSVIYPSTSTHSGYVHDIAGIGRDDNSGLNQPTSRSQNAGNMITISNPSDLDNNEFLVWGHNNGDLTTPNVDNVGGNIEIRLDRVWRARRTGGDGVGTVSVTVDMSSVSGVETASDLRLLVDTDGDFVNATEYGVSSSSGEVFRFNNVTIGQDNHFTIGSVDMYNTTLPVELTSFDVTHEPPIVVATWETASELNNDFFTLERAGEDLNFDVVAQQPGAGTTSIVHTYTAIDPHPFGGRSYYRLKQTDYDGTSTFSPVRSVMIDETDRELVLFPNPNDGANFVLTMGNAVFQLNEVEVINSHGITMKRQKISRSNLTEYPVDLGEKLPPGFYLVKAHYNGKQKTFRVVVP